MIITKKSPITGKFTSLDLPITQEQIDRWQEGEPIQRVMPDLTADQREFIITGLSPEEFELITAGIERDFLQEWEDKING